MNFGKSSADVEDGLDDGFAGLTSF